jgi:hypothetical protein
MSDHQSVVEGPQAAGIPTTKTTTEVIESDPSGVPMGTKSTSVSQTTGARPANNLANVGDGSSVPVPATNANIPGGGKPGKAAKPVWDTNHPKPVNVNSNVPNASAPADPSGPAGASGQMASGPASAPPPILVEADPAAPPAMAGQPGAAGMPPPAIVNTPAPAGGKVGGFGGLRWEPHLPTQARPNVLKYVSLTVLTPARCNELTK